MTRAVQCASLTVWPVTAAQLAAVLVQRATVLAKRAASVQEVPRCRRDERLPHAGRLQPGYITVRLAPPAAGIHNSCYLRDMYLAWDTYLLIYRENVSHSESVHAVQVPGEIHFGIILRKMYLVRDTQWAQNGLCVSRSDGDRHELHGDIMGLKLSLYITRKNIFGRHPRSETVYIYSEKK